MQVVHPKKICSIAVIYKISNIKSSDYLSEHSDMKGLKATKANVQIMLKGFIFENFITTRKGTAFSRSVPLLVEMDHFNKVMHF